MAKPDRRKIHFHYTDNNGINHVDEWCYFVNHTYIFSFQETQTRKKFPVSLRFHGDIKQVKRDLISMLKQQADKRVEYYEAALSAEIQKEKDDLKRRANQNGRTMVEQLADQCRLDLDVVEKISENVYAKGWGKEEVSYALRINGINPKGIIAFIKWMKTYKIVDKRVSRKLLDILC